MPYTDEGITHVRLRPLALDLAGGEPAVSPGAFEVSWESAQDECWHQVYINGRLAGVTARPQDRWLAVAAPVGREGVLSPLYARVVAVDAADRWTDFGEELAESAPEGGTRVRIAWQAGPYLDENLESFDIFADGRTGAVDYSAPLNEEPIPARPDGQAPWGYGCGGYGVGGYGASGACYEWVTDALDPGAWRFAIAAIDAAGNRLATAAEVACSLAPAPRPVGRFRLESYEPVARTATLAWEPSPDV
jgi:hypothetical protein